MKINSKNNKRLVTKVFQDVSKKYDLMNDIMSLGVHRIWKKKFVDWLNPQINTKLLDVASGTGDIAKLYLEKINYNGEAYCLDENEDMLNLNKKKFKNTNNINWFCNNAEDLPFEDNYFDYYTISFGIRNVENIDNALSEAYRVLKPGGRFLCLEFSKVKNDFLNKIYKIYSKSIPKIGKIVVGKSEPYEYLVDSIEKFYNQEDFLKKIENNKFSNSSYIDLNIGVVSIHSAWKI
ncbi:MAG: demethylmenaquinone methyltransferase / 2-methoxy-6-polyprenyl-1,4-benzoquinol methylase [Pelagibacterales bacterium]|nr:demethylmenaquinone methyltransferase / 2-methoxy-6-polyprenyl-1,4-benzoquinol methylase [Pelagibacterales bacterium]